VAFFSLSAGKRDMYILPALPALALAAAPYMDALAQRVAFRRARPRPHPDRSPS